MGIIDVDGHFRELWASSKGESLACGETSAHPAADDRAVPDGMILVSSEFLHVEGHREGADIFDAQFAGRGDSARANFSTDRPRNC